jgi:hypothetical protein
MGIDLRARAGVKLHRRDAVLVLGDLVNEASRSHWAQHFQRLYRSQKGIGARGQKSRWKIHATKLSAPDRSAS